MPLPGAAAAAALDNGRPLRFHSTSDPGVHAVATVAAFRQEVRDWLAANCPPSMRLPAAPGETVSGGRREPIRNPDSQLWLERCAGRGFTVPMWPRAYGGAELSLEQYLVLLDEMRRIRARPPLVGMGTSMIGPTLLEFGSEAQKQRHLPRIASGEVRWCQGYSEPGSGSDLASLRTRAEDRGDHFVINGSKIWTTLAQFADWMFMLVRTNPEAPKHEGISFVLLPMDQPGISVRPLVQISGNSHFCQCFFDNAIARKEDLVGELNRGWTVGKRLLQHERSGIEALSGATTFSLDAEESVESVARAQCATTGGRLADPLLRQRLAMLSMNQRAFALTQRRTVEESDGGRTPGAATSIFKYFGANLGKERQELLLSLRGFGALGWEGAPFSDAEVATARNWLGSKAASIAGGSNEVQLNIVAKRVLGLPD
jgi:alkylation response protein AidB-like acyl-CoA dehydrogenase